MSRILTASDRKNLIRLAFELPKGSPGRKAILAGLEKRVGPHDPVSGWIQKNRRDLDTVGKIFTVERAERGRENEDWVVSFSATPQKDYWVSVEYDDQADSYTGIDSSTEVIRGGLDVGDVFPAGKFLQFLNRLLKAAIKAKGDQTVRVKRERDDYGYVDPYGGYEVYVGSEMIGEVWKGLDKKWHSSLYGTGYGYNFRSKEDAVADLVEGGYKGTAQSRGQRNPTFE